jgi:hypothetical protein
VRRRSVFGAILAAWAFVGSPMNDKGALLGLMLLLVLGLPEGKTGMERSLAHAHDDQAQRW